MIAAVMAATITATILYTRSQTRIYAATASIVIDPQAPQVLGRQVDEIVQMGAGNFWSNLDYYKTQVEILTSREIALRAVRKDNLYQRILPPGREAIPHEQKIEQAAAILRGDVEIGQDDEHRVLRVTVLDEDAELAALLANAVVDAYVDFSVGRKTEGVASAARWLAEELDQVETDLHTSETALTEYKREHAMVSLEDKQALVSANIAHYTESLNGARARRIELEALLERVRSLQAVDVLESPIFMLGDSATFQTVKAQYFVERNAFLELDQEVGPKNPDYVKQKRKVDELYAALKTEAALIARSIEEQYQAAVSTEKALAGLVAQFEAQARALDDLRPQYQRLKRKEDSDSEKYGIVMAQLRTTDLTERLTASNIGRLDSAAPSWAPVYPRTQRNILIAAGASLILGIALAFLLNMLDRTVKTTEDVEQAASAPLLGIIPIVESGAAGASDPDSPRDLYVFHSPASRAAECCRSIRTNILFATADKDPRTILVSSPNPREGKTTTTIYLGTTMAQSGQRVLLIDSDLRRPRLHKSVGVSRTRGLTNLILGEVGIEDAIKSTEIPNMDVLPCGPTPPNPAELLMTERFRHTLAELERRYDRILLDSPPVLAVTDAVVLSQHAAGVILVVAAGKTTRDAVARASRQFADVDVRLTGVVLNQLDTDDRQYGYYYEYYAYGYGSDADKADRRPASSA